MNSNGILQCLFVTIEQLYSRSFKEPHLTILIVGSAFRVCIKANIAINLCQRHEILIDSGSGGRLTLSSSVATLQCLCTLTLHLLLQMFYWPTF